MLYLGKVYKIDPSVKHSTAIPFHSTKPMHRCMRELASRQVRDRACDAALSCCCLNLNVPFASCDRWAHSSAQHPPQSETTSSSCGAESDVDHTTNRWHTHCQAQPQPTTLTDAALDIPAMSEAMRWPRASNMRQLPRAALPWNSTPSSLAQPSRQPLCRSFASENSNQTQAEKFDLIRQEAGAVRVEGCAF